MVMPLSIIFSIQHGSIHTTLKPEIFTERILFDISIDFTARLFYNTACLSAGGHAPAGRISCGALRRG
jgi:hypothetical protein